MLMANYDNFFYHILISLSMGVGLTLENKGFNIIINIKIDVKLMSAQSND
jgi:hypothetical protein